MIIDIKLLPIVASKDKGLPSEREREGWRKEEGGVVAKRTASTSRWVTCPSDICIPLVVVLPTRLSLCGFPDTSLPFSPHYQCAFLRCCSFSPGAAAAAAASSSEIAFKFQNQRQTQSRVVLLECV